MASIPAATNCLQQRWIRFVDAGRRVADGGLGCLLRGDLQPRALRGERGLSCRFGVKACCAEGRRLRSEGWSLQDRVTNGSTCEESWSPGRG